MDWCLLPVTPAGPPWGSPRPPGRGLWETSEATRLWVDPNEQQMLLTPVLASQEPSSRSLLSPELWMLCAQPTGCSLQPKGQTLGHPGGQFAPQRGSRQAHVCPVPWAGLASPQAWALHRSSPKLLCPTRLTSFPTGVLDGQAWLCRRHTRPGCSEIWGFVTPHGLVIVLSMNRKPGSGRSPESRVWLVHPLLWPQCLQLSVGEPPTLLTWGTKLCEGRHELEESDQSPYGLEPL